MVKLMEEKTEQLGKVTPSLNEAVKDYAKLIGITKIELLEGLIAKELEGRVLTKGFIVPEKPFYFNMKELLEEGTVEASTNTPSRDFSKYYTVKKISNNLDSKNAEFRTYCYNDNKALHKGVFIYYFFGKEAKPVPLVFDYNIESNELTISFVKLSELTYLIESEEDVPIIEGVIESVKNNVERWEKASQEEELDFINQTEESRFFLDIMGATSDVIGDFIGRKKIDLLTKFNVNEFDSSLAEDVTKYSYVVPDSIKTEDIFKKLIQQEKELEKLNSKVAVLNELQEDINRISKWFIVEEDKPEEAEKD